MKATNFIKVDDMWLFEIGDRAAADIALGIDCFFLTRLTRRISNISNWTDLLLTSYRTKFPHVVLSPMPIWFTWLVLKWHHNKRDGVSNHLCLDCLLNRLFKLRSNKISKLRVSGLFDGNPAVTGGFPLQRVSNAENVTISRCDHEFAHIVKRCFTADWVIIRLFLS